MANTNAAGQFTRRWLLSACWLLLFTLVAAGQYRFDSWTIDHGLPQHSVEALVQTRDGYLWLATMGGLARFDGVRFTVFDKGNTPALRSNRFTCLAEDAEGTLWAGAQYGGLARYRDGEFATFTTAAGLPNDSVKELFATAEGLFINTEGGWALYQAGRLTPSAGPWWARLKGGAAAPAPAPAAATLRTPDGASWRWADEQASRLLKTHYDAAYRPVNYPANELELYIFTTSGQLLLADGAGALWGSLSAGEVFRIHDGALTRFRVADGPIYEQSAATHYQPSVQPGVRIQHELVSACAAPDGAIWFGTHTGLLGYRNGRVTRFTTAHGLTDNSIEALLLDREGTLWVGTPKGLTRVTRQFITGLTPAQGLPRLEVYPLLEDHRGDVWIGTNLPSRWSQGRLTNYSWAGFRRLGHLYALHEDRQRRLWVSAPDGLAWWQDGRFTQFPRAALRPLGADDDALTCYDIHDDRRGLIWLATDRGVFSWDGVTAQAYQERDGLPSNEVRVIHEDRAGRLWFGTARGLAQLANGRLTVFHEGEATHSKIVSLHEDEDGVLWLGTYDNGLLRFQEGRFTHYTAAQGLFCNEVFGILADDADRFWLSSNKGIYRVSRQQLNDYAAGRATSVTAVAYNKQDGMPSTECNAGRQPSALKTRDGRLWFPTQSGVAVFDPAAAPHNPLAPPVLIEAAFNNHQPVSVRDGLRLHAGQDNLEIHYTGLSFIKPEQVKFKYKLTGWDDDWVNAGTRRAAYYSKLAPGEYTFLVTAANSDAVWHATGAQLRVTVIPAFYQSWWFRALALLALGGAACALYQSRIRQLSSLHETKEAFSRQLLETQEAFARRLIDAQERERQRIAAELHDGLGQNLLVIKNRALLGAMESGEPSAQAHFTDINEAVGATLEEVRAIAYDLRPQHLGRLGLASTIEEMAERVSAATGLSIAVSLAPLDGLFAPEAEINLFRIVQEALNNIVKHAAAQNAVVQITRDAAQVTLTISDDGCGFAHEAAPNNGKRGLGLVSIAERVRMLGGAMELQTAVGRGTTIIISIRESGVGSRESEFGSRKSVSP